MELQLIMVEWSEQARGSRSFVSDEKVHFAEGFVSLEGQVSVTVRFRSIGSGSLQIEGRKRAKLWRLLRSEYRRIFPRC